ncbi:MAG: IclR family transcriptional regulator [Burkholderiaceae bacterium]|nr:IclR family transcriptional regulator [Burkholderiaceae bacterium]MDO9088516.1 IclR family transcriptional regulator [Burkholderiaceae bacterium]MDP1968714.1 IclR family transcriptional regulator [Burkholderiaceae bacterium]
MSDVKAALRTLNLFELFAKQRQPLVLSDLSEQLDIPSSSCLQLIRTLLQHGYLYQTSKRGGYYPTLRLFDCVQAIVTHDSVNARVLPALTALRDETGETVTLGKMQGRQLIYLLVLDSPHLLRPAIMSGMLRPLHSTGSGKALLGTMEPKERKAILRAAGMARLTPFTVTSSAKLEQLLAEGAERGWHVNRGEGAIDLASVAASVMIAGEPYAIAVIGPISRLPSDVGHATALLKAKAAIEQPA